MKTLALAFVLVLFAAPALAQTPVTQSKRIAWDHPGTDVQKFQLGLDGVFTDIPGGVTPRDAALPAMTVGTHVLEVRACFDIECATSDPLSVRLVLVEAPDNVRIIDGQ